MNGSGPYQRSRQVYEGRVQGVGFRYRVSTIAKRLPVTGYVRNLPDGCVELIAEGIKVDIDDLLEQVRSGMGSAITRERQESQAATGEFTGFSIRM